MFLYSCFRLADSTWTSRPECEHISVLNKYICLKAAIWRTFMKNYIYKSPGSTHQIKCEVSMLFDPAVVWDLCHTDWLNMTLYVGHWESLISLSVLHIWAMKVNKSVWGQPLMFVDLSVEDGSDLYLNQISFLTLTVAHSSSLSPPHSHT